LAAVTKNNFDGPTLQEAVLRTFRRRKTDVPASLHPLLNELIETKHIQWAAFRARLQQPHVPESFQELATSLHGFLASLVEAVFTGEPFLRHWYAPGPWVHDTVIGYPGDER
jgi:hypothetical protein